jgi:hypothetical protein
MNFFQKSTFCTNMTKKKVVRSIVSKEPEKKTVTIGEQIKKQRNLKNCSQDLLIKLANVYLEEWGYAAIPDRTAMCRIESGQRDIKYQEGLAIARALNVPPNSFIIH